MILLKYIFFCLGESTSLYIFPWTCIIPCNLFLVFNLLDWSRIPARHLVVPKFFFKTSFWNLFVLFSSPLRFLLLFSDHAVVANSGSNDCFFQALLTYTLVDSDQGLSIYLWTPKISWPTIWKLLIITFQCEMSMNVEINVQTMNLSLLHKIVFTDEGTKWYNPIISYFMSGFFLK